jgi:hypothetical protein
VRHLLEDAVDDRQYKQWNGMRENGLAYFFVFFFGSTGV